MHGFDQVGTREGADRRSGGVQQGDKQQRPAGTDTRITDRGYGEETHDNVRQTGGTAHQRGGDEEHIDGGLLTFGISAEAEILNNAVQSLKQVDTGVVTGGVQHRGAEAGLRQHMAGHQNGQEHRRYQEGENQYAVLGNLGVGNPLHAAEYGVEEHDRHADHHAHVHVHFQEAGEHDTHAAHLAGHIGKGDKDHADHRDGTRHVGIVTVTNEVRHGELAEFSQVGRQQHRQQHIAAGPPHQIHRGVVTGEGDDTRHGNKRCRGHPVRRGGRAVGDR